MKKFNLALSKLTVKKLYTLAMRFKEIIVEKMTEEMGIAVLVNKFITEFDKYQIALQKASISASQLQEEDAERDNLFIGMRTHIHNYTRFPDAVCRAIAVDLLQIIDQQGKEIYRQSYKDETAAIDNIAAQFDTRIEDLQAINVDVWYNLLKVKQAAFEANVRLYNEAKTENKQLEAAYILRPQLIESIDNMMAFLPLQAYITENAELQAMVDVLQTEADRF